MTNDAPATVDGTVDAPALSPAVFDEMSERQIDALCNVAFGGNGGGMPRVTLESLERRGLIERYVNRQNEGRLYFNITMWEMPVHVHIVFCDWCSYQKLSFMDDDE